MRHDQPDDGRFGIDARTWIVWLIVGAVVSLLFQFQQAASENGDWAALLLTGEDNPFRPVVEEQLGDVPLVEGDGHDGQATFVVALDLDGDRYGELRDDAALRWRRIVVPFVAGIGGLLEGRTLLYSIIAVASLGYGLAVAAAADIASLLGLRRWTVVGVLLNFGMLLSTQLLTPDTVAFGLALTGLALVLRGHHWWAAALFALAVLAKEQYVLIAFGAATHQFVSGHRRTAAVVAVGPLVPVAMWYAYVTTAVGPVTESNGALALPFVGVSRALSTFDRLPPSERNMLVISLLLFGLAVVATVATRRRIIRHLAMPWLLAATVLSHEVWQFGNNPLRVLMPLWLLAVYVADEWLQRRSNDGAGSRPVEPQHEPIGV